MPLNRASTVEDLKSQRVSALLGQGYSGIFKSCLVPELSKNVC